MRKRLRSMRGSKAALFTSNSAEWETPDWLYKRLDAQWHFSIDVCATLANAKCYSYWDISSNALTHDWSHEICWMNPPYGRKIGDWVRKAYEESQLGATVVALLPARTDVKWFHDYVVKAGHIEFLRGRLKFSGSSQGAPFPSMIVVFHPGLNKAFMP